MERGARKNSPGLRCPFQAPLSLGPMAAENRSDAFASGSTGCVGRTKRLGLAHGLPKDTLIHGARVACHAQNKIFTRSRELCLAYVKPHDIISNLLC